MDWISHSRLFELARQGKRLTHILAVIPLAGLFATIGQVGAIPVIILVTLLYGLPDGTLWDFPSTLLAGLWIGLILVSAFLLVYVFVGLWVYFFEGRPFWTLGYERKGALKKYLRGFLIGGLMFSLAVGIMAAPGYVAFESGEPDEQGFAALGGVLFILIGWIVQGGAEELLTRGWVLPVIGARYRPWIGLAVSSLIFAALHALNENVSVIAMINLVLFGVFTGLYALREGSIWGVSALHSVWNWVQGNFFGFEVSGTYLGGGTLINLMETGPDWITGGLFGPEGGVAVTAVLIVGSVIVLFWKKAA